MNKAPVRDRHARRDDQPQTGSHRSHYGAVLDAEVRLVLRELAMFGVLTREELTRRTEANVWQCGTLEAALREGVRRGVIELRPGGLVALSRTDSAAHGQPGGRGLREWRV